MPKGRLRLVFAPFSPGFPKRARTRGDNEAPRAGDQGFPFFLLFYNIFSSAPLSSGRSAQYAPAFCAAMKCDQNLLSLTKI
jgi:hypothetical protein